MTGLDEITRRLADLQDRLLALPGDAFAARYELLVERDQLRAEAARHAVQFETERSTTDLLAERDAIDAALGAEAEAKSGLMAWSGPGGTGGAAAAVSGEQVELALLAKATSTLDVLRARRARIEQLLARRGGDQAQPSAGVEATQA